MFGVYIHIPFCHKICTYCDFSKVLNNNKYVSKYLDSLSKEIKERYHFEGIDTIYIGGGTPSSLNIQELDRLLSIISIFRLKDNYEYTIECNIDDIDIDKINLFKSYGINRISFGVESFDKDNLDKLGRSHDEDTIFDNIYLTKKYFDNINIDLIYGISSDIEKVKYDLLKFLELDIPHISYYSLIIEEHTKLYINKQKYIDDEIDNKMYEYINNTLKKHGYKHYEISNYAKPGYDSIHNKNYWLNGEYYGFGLGAVSFINKYRITNTKNLTKYLKGDRLKSKIYEDNNTCKENDLILGLRMTDGINIKTFNQKYQDDLLKREVISKLINEGYLVIDKDNLKIKDEYLYIENTILMRIVGSEL